MTPTVELLAEIDAFNNQVPDRLLAKCQDMPVNVRKSKVKARILVKYETWIASGLGKSTWLTNWIVAMGVFENNDIIEQIAMLFFIECWRSKE